MSIFQFQFVNSFLALFYTAFYLQDIEKLKELLAALLITRQVIGNVKVNVARYLLSASHVSLLLTRSHSFHTPRNN